MHIERTRNIQSIAAYLQHQQLLLVSAGTVQVLFLAAKKFKRTGLKIHPPYFIVSFRRLLIQPCFVVVTFFGRRKSIGALLQALFGILATTRIATVVARHSLKRCCLFRTQVKAATKAPDSFAAAEYGLA